jgi:DNA-binding XRE family transcriptional regulator
LVPGVPVHLKATRPEFKSHAGSDLPTQLRLRLRRRALGHAIEDAAKCLGVRRMTWTAWELGAHEPGDRWYPALIRYLGNEPWVKPEALGGFLKAERRRRGIGPEEAAKLIGIGSHTLRAIERGVNASTAQRQRIESFLFG